MGILKAYFQASPQETEIVPDVAASLGNVAHEHGPPSFDLAPHSGKAGPAAFGDEVQVVPVGFKQEVGKRLVQKAGNLVEQAGKLVAKGEKQVEKPLALADHPSILALWGNDVTGPIARILRDETEHPEKIRELWAIITKHADPKSIEDTFSGARDVMITPRGDEVGGYLVSRTLNIAKSFTVLPDKAVEFAKEIKVLAYRNIQGGSAREIIDYWIQNPEKIPH